MYERRDFMDYNENTSIFEYASFSGCGNCLTFYQCFSFLLKNLECIVCRESAADLLGYSNGGFRNKIRVYSTQQINEPFLDCIIVDSLDKIPYQDYKGIKVSPIKQAIVDMLAQNDTDQQVLFETHANYYCKNNDSYMALEIPFNLQKKAKFYQEEGARYYNV